MTVNPHQSPAFFRTGEVQSSPVEYGLVAWTYKVYQTHTMPGAASGRASPPHTASIVPQRGSTEPTVTSATPAGSQAQNHSGSLSLSRGPGSLVSQRVRRFFSSPTISAAFLPVCLISFWRRSEACRDKVFFFIIIISLPRIGVCRCCELLLDINIQYQNAAVVYTHHWGCCCVVRQITQWSDVLGFSFSSIYLVFLSVILILIYSLEQYLGTLL